MIDYINNEITFVKLKKLESKRLLFYFMENRNNLNMIRIHGKNLKKTDLQKMLDVTINNLDKILRELQKRIKEIES